MKKLQLLLFIFMFISNIIIFSEDTKNPIDNNDKPLDPFNKHSLDLPTSIPNISTETTNPRSPTDEKTFLSITEKDGKFITNTVLASHIVSKIQANQQLKQVKNLLPNKNLLPTEQAIRKNLKHSILKNRILAVGMLGLGSYINFFPENSINNLKNQAFKLYKSINDYYHNQKCSQNDK